MSVLILQVNYHRQKGVQVMLFKDIFFDTAYLSFTGLLHLVEWLVLLEVL